MGSFCVLNFDGTPKGENSFCIRRNHVMVQGTTLNSWKMLIWFSLMPWNHLITEICSGVRLFERWWIYWYHCTHLFKVQKRSYSISSLYWCIQIKRKGDFLINFPRYYNIFSTRVCSSEDVSLFPHDKRDCSTTGTKKYEFEYVNLSSFFNLFENQENSYDEDLDYKVDSIIWVMI